MSVNPYYPGPCGIYSSLLQQRDNQETVSEERLREARFVDATEGQNTNPDNGQSDVIGASSFINARY